MYYTKMTVNCLTTKKVLSRVLTTDSVIKNNTKNREGYIFRKDIKMQYIFAESLKELEIRYKTRQTVDIFANLDSELEWVIFKNKHLFENEEIDFWISIDPYNDTLIKTENIQYLLKFGKKLQDKDVLNKIKNNDWFKGIEASYSINEIENFANDLVKGCEFAISNKRNIVCSGD